MHVPAQCNYAFYNSTNQIKQNPKQTAETDLTMTVVSNKTNLPTICTSGHNMSMVFSVGFEGIGLFM